MKTVVETITNPQCILSRFENKEMKCLPKKYMPQIFPFGKIIVPYCKYALLYF